jgi:hypothetical protein
VSSNNICTRRAFKQGRNTSAKMIGRGFTSPSNGPGGHTSGSAGGGRSNGGEEKKTKIQSPSFPSCLNSAQSSSLILTEGEKKKEDEIKNVKAYKKTKD